MSSSGHPQNIGEIQGVASIDVFTSVASGNLVTSPISGRKAAFVCMTVIEKRPQPHMENNEIGSVIYGDVVALKILDGSPLEGTTLDVIVRRALVTFITRSGGGGRGDENDDDLFSIDNKNVPELVPLFAKATGNGALYYLERRVLCGDRFRLRATVERYRSDDGEPPRLAVRSDLAPVMLDEVVVFEASSSSSSSS